MAQQESQKLSQREIDALLEMLPQEEEAEEEAEAPTAPPPSGTQEPEGVQPYDFRGAVKLSKEQVYTLQVVHENLAKRLTAYLSVYLRSKVQVTLSALDQGTYAVFISDMPMPTITHIVKLAPLPGRVLLGLQAEVAIAIIDRMLGGAGTGRAQSRELTDLEVTLLRKAVEKILAELVGAWESIVELEPTIEGVVMNPLFAGIAFPSDSALLAVYDVFFEESSGTMSITIPFSVLDPIGQELSSGMWGRRAADGTRGDEDEFTRQMAAHLAQINVPLSVRLSTPPLDLEEIGDLQPGDVLLLDAFKEGLLAKVFLGGKHKFWGRPGILGKRMAVQIERVIKPESPDLALSEAAQEKITVASATSDSPLPEQPHTEEAGAPEEDLK